MNDNYKRRKPWNEYDDLHGYLDGMSIERQELKIEVEGTKVFLDIQAIGGGNVTYYIDGSQRVLNCTTGSGVNGKARVELTQGTVDQDVRNIVYVAYSEQEGKLSLVVSSYGYPKKDYALVAIVVIQDYTSVNANGALGYQRATEAITHNGRGAIAWGREKLRLKAEYYSGIDQSLILTSNSGEEDNINFAVTSGKIFQLHRQDFPNYDVSSRGIFVNNVSGNGVLGNKEKIFDLNKIHEISDGTALVDGDCINLVIWGDANYSEETAKLYVNIPNGKYTSEDDAISDAKNTAITALPINHRSMGFLIAKIVLRYNTSNNGTWSNLLTDATEVWHTETQDISSPNYPSDYTNNLDITSTFTKSGASKIRVHFNDFNTEVNYDYARLLDSNNTELTKYHGDLQPFTTPAIVGDTLKIRFTSDGSITRKGWHIDALEYATTEATGGEIIDLRGIPSGFNLGAGGGTKSSVRAKTKTILTGITTLNLATPDTLYDTGGIFTDGGLSRDFTSTAEGVVTYLGSGIVCSIHGTSECSVDKACKVTYSMIKNGISIGDTPHGFTSTTKESSIGITNMIKIENGDVFKVQIKSDTSNTELTIDTLNVVFTTS